MNRLVKRWPNELQRTLRLEALRRGMTLRALLIEAAEEWISNRAPAAPSENDAADQWDEPRGAIASMSNPD